MSDVDVIIPCYNGEAFLAETLDSVLAQTHRASRVLVVDDGSTDGTRQVVERYAGRVEYLYKPNGGQASARNFGIERATSEFVCLLDADDLLHPSMLERLLARFDPARNLDLVHSRTLAFVGRESHHLQAENWRPAVEWTNYLEPLAVHCAIHGSATVARRSLYERFGGLCEDRAIQGCEDWLFWLQLAIGGAAIEGWPEPLCYYRFHPGASSASPAGLAERESELMRRAHELFERRLDRRDRHWAFLAIGMASIAGRWLDLGAETRYAELMAVARRICPEGPWHHQFDHLPTSTRDANLATFQARLAVALLDLDSPWLAATLFLRCGRHWPKQPSDIEGRLEAAMDRIVAAELERSPTAPSWVSYVASGLAFRARARGDAAAAREGFERALRLDPGDRRAALHLAESELRMGRLGSALARWRVVPPAIPVLYRARQASRAIEADRQSLTSKKPSQLEASAATSPTVYVLVGVHNRVEITRRFVRCLAAQSYPSVHLVLVDDGSNDGTAEMTRQEMPTATILRGDGNLWFAGCLDLAYRWLDAHPPALDDVIHISNDDTTFAPDFLANAVEILEQRPNSMVMAEAYDATGHLIERGGHYDYRGANWRPAKNDEEVNVLCTRGLFFRERDRRLIGDFRPRLLPHYFSDFEYSARARRKGIRLGSDSRLRVETATHTDGLLVLPPELRLRAFTARLFSKRFVLNPVAMATFIALAAPWRDKPIGLARVFVRTVRAIAARVRL